MRDRSLTVIVPTYNGSRFLRSSLDSLGSQTEQPRVIVVDDGSSDDSAAIADAHDAVDTVIRQSNRGVAAARNRGLAVADTHYVAFMDQDDLWHETRSTTLLDLAQRSGAAATATSEQVFARQDDHGALLEAGDPRIEWPTHWIDDGAEPELVRGPVDGSDDVELVTVGDLMTGAAFVTTAVMYEREAAITAGGCAPFVRAADDHVLNVNVANIFGPIARIRQPLLYYRIHPEATSNTSPLVLPVLTLQLALRHGRALPSEARLGHNLEHLLHQLADEPSLSRREQLALLTLSTGSEDRLAWTARWIKRTLKSTATALRDRVGT